LSQRINALIFKSTFDVLIAEKFAVAKIVESACDELSQSEKFRRVLEYVLALGNYLNFGSRRGSAYGFKLDSLLKMGDTRASATTTLTHFFYESLEKYESKLCDFPSQLTSVERASKISIADLSTAAASLKRTVDSLLAEIAAAEKISLSDAFVTVMKEFAVKASEEVQELNTKIEEIEQKFEKTCRYYGEDPTQTKSGDFFTIINNFLLNVEKAKTDINRARVRKEQEEKKKLLAQQKAAQKQISTKPKANDKSNNPNENKDDKNKAVEQDLHNFKLDPNKTVIDDIVSNIQNSNTFRLRRMNQEEEESNSTAGDDDDEWA